LITAKNKMKVTIDGQAIEVEPGTTILQAARMIGGESVPPAMCYYSKLEGSGGKCRCCLVEVAKEVTQIQTNAKTYGFKMHGRNGSQQQIFG
jgi:NADH dehydrogenase/NADH:ubiquinone oxidoreductase subunit G